MGTAINILDGAGGSLTALAGKVWVLIFLVALAILLILSVTAFVSSVTMAIRTVRRSGRWSTPRARHVSLATILVALTVANFIVAFEFHPLRTQAAASPGWRVFVDPTNHWTVEFPASWHAERIAEYTHGLVYPHWEDGILISNVHRRFEKQQLPPNAWGPWFDTSGAPSSAVIVQIVKFYSGGFVANYCASSNTPTPLSVRMMTRSAPSGPATPGSSQLSVPHLIVRGSAQYSVTAVLGRKVSAADRGTLERIIASISFNGVASLPPTIQCH